MNLCDIVNRAPAPEPWAEGEKIPWNDPAFSARMLAEHFRQDHDAASRRAEIVQRQVRWIHEHVLQGRPGRVLDLGCGPGLYTSRLAALGHSCVGIDFGPASIAHAREQASATGADCTYIKGDLRTTPFEPAASYDLAMLIYGELNVFRRSDALAILEKARRALAPGGRIVLEPHTFEAVQSVGQGPATWYTSRSGLFSERPHLMLYEPFWHAEPAIATERYFVVDAKTGAVTRYASSMHAYTEEGYRRLLTEAGFRDVTLYPSLTGEPEPSQAALLAIVAQA
jgi:SAM-dependent methyltransferase